MGKHKGETDELEKILKTGISCLSLLAVSLAGGLVLGCWEYQYHPTNTQQWMVPVGLILMITPMLMGFVAFASEFCNPEDENISGTSRRAVPVHDSVMKLRNEVEKCSGVIIV